MTSYTCFAFIIVLLLQLNKVLLHPTMNYTQACVLNDKDGVTEKPYKVLIFVESELLDVFLNWLIYYYNVCSSFKHLDVICMDDRTQEVLGKHSHM